MDLIEYFLWVTMVKWNRAYNVGLTKTQYITYIFYSRKQTLKDMIQLCIFTKNIEPEQESQFVDGNTSNPLQCFTMGTWVAPGMVESLEVQGIWTAAGHLAESMHYMQIVPSRYYCRTIYSFPIHTHIQTVLGNHCNLIQYSIRTLAKVFPD